MIGMVPTSERFEAAKLAGFQVNQRLVMQIKRARCNGSAQVSFHGEAVSGVC